MLRATQNETPPKQAWLLKLATTQLKVITKSARAKAAPNTIGPVPFLYPCEFKVNNGNSRAEHYWLRPLSLSDKWKYPLCWIWNVEFKNSEYATSSPKCNEIRCKAIFFAWAILALPWQKNPGRSQDFTWMQKTQTALISSQC